MVTSLDRKLVGWSAAFVVSQALIAKVLGPSAPRVLEVQTAWSARRYREILGSMDAAGISRYRRHYHLDLVHPAIYGTALRIGGRRLGELTALSPATRTALAVAPVASAAGDYIENAVGLYLLDHRDAISDSTVRATTVVSTAKWVLALGTLGYLAQGYLRVWTRALTRR
ncbi:hypothetical protein G4H71_17145 [Rhodococcus triatomae]|uniref:Uncharacterized protein n=1 Tax=Rhodococcus triatomae TaxID=300028 RepID=A0A1G8FQJ7_9NOCA|nr:hypothetical protein [Rhodococcus triatomae]QNG19548.1 hypothetical protein G4H72_13230 [Rhodococcus triatomae]QNG24537.1 hypothetical protein G4H71_17145 [Rhodococcus triatomae]SDH84374.1 hypothetical protein SAMN05444695_103360 [Rhodococcus triatomae]